MKIKLTWKDNSGSETEQEVRATFGSPNSGNTPEPLTLKVAADVESAVLEINETEGCLCSIKVAAKNATEEAVSSDRFVTSTKYPDQFTLAELSGTEGQSILEKITIGRTGKIEGYNSDFNASGSFSSVQPDGSIISFTTSRVRKFDKDLNPTDLVEPLANLACGNIPAVAPSGLVYSFGQRAAAPEVFVHDGNSYSVFKELPVDLTNITRYPPLVDLDDDVVFFRSRSEFIEGASKEYWDFIIIDSVTKEIETITHEVDANYTALFSGVTATGELYIVLQSPADEVSFLTLYKPSKTVSHLKSPTPFSDLRGSNFISAGYRMIVTKTIRDAEFDDVSNFVVFEPGSNPYGYTTIPLAKGEHTGIGNPVLLPSGLVVTFCYDTQGNVELVFLNPATNQVRFFPTNLPWMGHHRLMRCGKKLILISNTGDYYEFIIETEPGVAVDQLFYLTNAGAGLPMRF